MSYEEWLEETIKCMDKEYAKNKGWNSIQKAITGGAEFIGSGYITKGQDTLYYQKFNVISAKNKPTEKRRV